MDFNELKEQPVVGPVFKSSDEWYNILFPKFETVILDPDGWDRSNYEFSWFVEQITEEEFRNRLLYSTCIHNPEGVRMNVMDEARLFEQQRVVQDMRVNRHNARVGRNNATGSTINF